MRHVGEAVKGHTVMSRGAMLTDKTSQVHLIGIAPWGIVEHRSELIGEVRRLILAGTAVVGQHSRLTVHCYSLTS